MDVPCAGNTPRDHGTLCSVDGITRTWTRFEWNAQEGRWKVVQHFPLAKVWDNTTKSYDPKEEVTFVGIPVD